MKVKITPKDAQELYPTDILFQSVFWGKVKNRLGWKTLAFNVSSPYPMGDVLVLTKSDFNGRSIVYVPQGPEHGPEPESYGIFLEALSCAMIDYLEPSTVFIRYDLPWVDPYAFDEYPNSPDSRGLLRPEGKLRELRMNFGTRSWNLKKAPYDLTVADALIVDLTAQEEDHLARMKPKTRYNIRLAERRGVGVHKASARALPIFYELYQQTTLRNGFFTCDYRHFSSLFESRNENSNRQEISFFLATHRQEVLAGAIVAYSGQNATYLFGASSNQSRNLMGSYALHWHIIKTARAEGFLFYDMGAISPAKDPEHPFYGMFRFKVGFGGRMIHRAGSWDFPLKNNEYEHFRNHETLSYSLEKQFSES